MRGEAALLILILGLAAFAAPLLLTEKSINASMEDTKRRNSGPVTIVLDESHGNLRRGKVVDGYISFSITFDALIAETKLNITNTPVSRVAVEARLSCEPGLPTLVEITLGRIRAWMVPDGVGIYVFSTPYDYYVAAEVSGFNVASMQKSPNSDWHTIKVEAVPLDKDTVNVTLTLDGETVSRTLRYPDIANTLSHITDWAESLNVVANTSGRECRLDYAKATLWGGGG